VRGLPDGDLRRGVDTGGGGEPNMEDMLVRALPDGLRINRDIPIPLVKRRYRKAGRWPTSPWIAFVKMLYVGDSFAVDYFDMQSAIRWMRKAGYEAIAVNLGHNHYRVWRIK
jgi:hypothetical protein